MIIDFSSIGSGDGSQTNLCYDCRYSIKIKYRDRAPTVSWLTGEQIYEQYGNQDVKITIQSIQRCARHANHRREAEKGRPAFLEAAIGSGIDVKEKVDEYRYDILRHRR